MCVYVERSCWRPQWEVVQPVSVCQYDNSVVAVGNRRQENNEGMSEVSFVYVYICAHLCMVIVKVLAYPVFIYLLECTPALTGDAHFTGYSNKL